MPGLTDRVALVTGAGGGIGRALAIALGAAGARVIALGRHLDDLVPQVRSAGGRALAFEVDLRDAEAVKTALEEGQSVYGPVDLLVNNAAVMYLAPLADAEVADWHEMVDVNLKAPLALIGALLPAMIARGDGHIVNLSSISARRVGPGVAVYGATKSALDTVSEGLRQELAGRGVRVTALQLGAVDTALNDKIRHPAMRRLIKTRASSYQALAVDDAVAMVMHLLTLPQGVNAAQIFLVPSDQAG